MSRTMGWLAIVLLSGCGGAVTSGPDGGSLDAGGDSDGAVITTGPLGFVTLASSTVPPSLVANATFLRGGSAFICTETVEGACTFFACSPRTQGNGGIPPSAGALEIAGGSEPLTFSAASSGSYDPVKRNALFFSGGETLVASATGDEVPAFSVAIEAPGLISMSAPTPPAGDWNIDRAQDLTLKWSGAAERLVLTFGSNRSDPLEVECSYPGGDGSGTVPAAALLHLPAGGGFYEVRSRSVKQIAAGAWHVSFRADSAAISAGGAAFNGGAIFQ